MPGPSNLTSAILKIPCSYPLPIIHNNKIIHSLQCSIITVLNRYFPPEKSKIPCHLHSKLPITPYKALTSNLLLTIIGTIIFFLVVFFLSCVFFLKASCNNRLILIYNCPASQGNTEKNITLALGPLIYWQLWL